MKPSAVERVVLAAELQDARERLLAAGRAAWRLGGEAAFLELVVAEDEDFPCSACEGGPPRARFSFRSSRKAVVCSICRGAGLLSPAQAAERLALWKRHRDAMKSKALGT